MKNLRLITNWSCNKRCSFCYQDKYDNNFLTLSDVKKLNLSGIENITIMGGEPLLNPEISDIVFYLRNQSSNFHINIDTNGMLLENNISVLINIDRLTIDMGFDKNNNPVKWFFKNTKLKKILKHFRFKNRIKFNYVFSKVNENIFYEEFVKSAYLLKVDYPDSLITICEDFINPPDKKYIDDFETSLIKKEYIEKYGLYIYTHCVLDKIGYFKKDNFENTDLIVYKKDGAIFQTNDFNTLLSSMKNMFDN